MSFAAKLSRPFRKGFRKARLKLAGFSCRDQGWAKEIHRCQQEVSETDAHPHYLKAYRDAELWYWLHIPSWMTDLSKAGFKVNKVLDVGCAYGTLALFSQRMFNCEIYCTDFTDIYLSEKLKQNYNFNFAVNNIEREEFPWPLQFDVIIFTEVLEHLNFHPKPTLRKLRSLLLSNGKLFLTTPDAKEWGLQPNITKALKMFLCPEQNKRL